MPKPASLLLRVGGRNSSGRTSAFDVDDINLLASMAGFKSRVSAVLLTLERLCWSQIQADPGY
jgi:hypothetical protein